MHNSYVDGGRGGDGSNVVMHGGNGAPGAVPLSKICPSTPAARGVVTDVTIAFRVPLGTPAHVRRIRERTALDDAAAKIEADGEGATSPFVVHGDGLKCCEKFGKVCFRTKAHCTHEENCELPKPDKKVLSQVPPWLSRCRTNTISVCTMKKRKILIPKKSLWQPEHGSV